jgi:hypothetical protein
MKGIGIIASIIIAVGIILASAIAVGQISFPEAMTYFWGMLWAGIWFILWVIGIIIIIFAIGFLLILGIDALVHRIYR